MANYVYIATSLDGYIATPDGGVEWLDEIPNPGGEDFGFADFMGRVDALLMGSATFGKVLSFGLWPYKKKVFVLSNRLSEVPEDLEGMAEIIAGEPEQVVRDLKNRGFGNLYVDGGKVIQSFLKDDLIDEMIITTVPVILGKGIPLFGELDHAIRFNHVETEVFNDYLVKSRYVRQRDE